MFGDGKSLSGAMTSNVACPSFLKFSKLEYGCAVGTSYVFYKILLMFYQVESLI